MTLKISVVGPVLNEVDFIGFCIMQTLPFIHEYIYALDEASSDGTRDLLHHIKDKYAHEKLTILETPNFHPSDMPKYNAAFNACIEKSTGDGCWFLHPDMLVENPDKILSMPEKALAWFVYMTSYAKDMKTIFKTGRAKSWKNIHRKKFGLHYYGEYGSQNEDFYHSAITGQSYKHHGEKYGLYPFTIMDSGLKVSHFCELKSYARRFEKMKFCLTTQNPAMSPGRIEELAMNHPRVTLEDSSRLFGHFETEAVEQEPLPIFEQFKDEFGAFKKTAVEV